MKLILTAHQRTTPNKMLFTVALGAVLFISGCASISAPEKSSTLAAFEQLSVQPDGTRSWRNTAAAKVSTVHIDPQAIVFASDIRINDEQRQTLRQTLSEALTRQFSEAGIRVVAASSASTDAGAITVRANITAVELSDPFKAARHACQPGDGLDRRFRVFACGHSEACRNERIAGHEVADEWQGDVQGLACNHQGQFLPEAHALHIGEPDGLACCADRDDLMIFGLCG